MNPVLLKPQSEIGAQVVVQGRVIGNARAREYQALKPKLMPAVLESYARIEAEADLVLVEGAGSAAEINLREGDIANMGFARAADCPVALIGDIDRGGIFAQILGTQGGARARRRRHDRRLHRQQVPRRREPVRRRHGDDRRAHRLARASASCRSSPARRACRRKTRSALARSKPAPTAPVTIAVPMLARIANFDEFDPLRMEPSVRLVFVASGRAAAARRPRHPARQQGDDRRSRFLSASRAGTSIFSPMRGAAGGCSGVCGGYQMLGTSVADPDGIEGPAREAEGLGLLDVETVLTGEKTLSEVEGERIADGAPFRGYEMHVGRTSGPGLRPAVSALRRRAARRRDLSRTASSPAPMCMACSPTIGSARRGSASLGAAIGDRLRGDGRAHARRACRSLRGPSRPRRDPQACAMSAAPASASASITHAGR